MKMASTTDSLVFGPIFATSESVAIWSDSKRTGYYLQFESALANAEAQFGIIPAPAAKAIASKCDVNLINFGELTEETRRVGYPVLPLVKQLVRRVNDIEPGLGEWAHWGATTQDVTDTTTVLQLRDTCQLVAKSLDGIISALRELSMKHASTVMAARSNLQQAVPMTFGFKMARLLNTFQRHQQRLEEILPRLQVVEFGGAAGTLAAISDSGVALQVQEALAQTLGLNVPEIAWHTERDRIAEIGLFFGLITATCAKFAMDIKLLMQTEVGEVSEPYAPHRGSSSTMPQKRNPISSVYITAMSSAVKQLSTALLDAMVEDHERSTGPWEIEWIVLPQIATLTHATLMHTQELLEGLEVHPVAMRKNLASTNGAIVSEAVMIRLGREMGRQVAHDLVYDMCRQLTVEPGRSLFELLVDDPEVRRCNISVEELKQLCEPENYTGMSELMTKRVLGCD